MASSRKPQKAAPPKRAEANDFESVAKRLGCDPDLKAFDKKLGKIARTEPPSHKK
jgi:hypothetical protein